MTDSTLSSWTRMRKKNTTGRVAEFYSQLVRSVLGGDVVDRWSDSGSDLTNETLGIEVEIKASTNDKHFRISSRQRSRYVEKLSFPLDHILYALCSYRGKQWVGATRSKPGHTGSHLNRTRTKQDFLTGLAGLTDDMYLFDIDVISAFENYLGISAGKFAGTSRTEECLVLKRMTHIRPLWNGSRHAILSQLGLNTADWKLGRFELERSIVVDKHTYVVEFNLFTILRPGFHRRLVRAVSLPPNLYRYKGAK